MSIQFDEFTEKIERFSDGINRGGRFLLGPKCTFSNHNGIMIMGGSPGTGGTPESEVKGDEIKHSKSMNAFINPLEVWKSNLQGQVRLLFLEVARRLWDRDTGATEYHYILQWTLSTNFSPFTHKSLDEMKDNEVEFCRDLWTSYFDEEGFKEFDVILCIGNGEKRSAWKYIRDIVQNRDAEKLDQCKGIKVWGSGKVKYLFMRPKGTLILGLPHLGTWQFLGSTKTQAQKASQKVEDLIVENIDKERLVRCRDK